MSSTKKSRAQMTGSNPAGSPRSTELTTPRRSSRNRKLADIAGSNENVVQSPSAQKRGRKSLPNGNVVRSPDVSANTRRSARLQNSEPENPASPVVTAGGRRRSKAKDNEGFVTPDLSDLNPKDSSGGRRGSLRKSRNAPVNSRSSSGKRKLSHNNEESPASEEVVITERGETSVNCDISSAEKVDDKGLFAGEPLPHGDAATKTQDDKVLEITKIERDSGEEIPASKKRRKSRDSGLEGTDSTASQTLEALKAGGSVENADSKELPMDIQVAEDSNTVNATDAKESEMTEQSDDSDDINDINKPSSVAVEVAQVDSGSNDVLQGNTESSAHDYAELQTEVKEIKEMQEIEMHEERSATTRTDSEENVSEVNASDKSNIVQQPHSTSPHSLSKSEEDRTDPIDALVRDLAENQTKDAAECPPEKSNGQRRKESRRRSSFIRGRLSQAAVSQDVAELSSCIPFEYPADQRLEMLVQKAARHTLDRLMEEFSEVDEDNRFVTEALEITGDEITKLKTEGAFVRASNKESFLPHPENVALETRITQIQKTITRLNAESEEWDQVIEHHKSAAEEAKRESEKEQLLTVDGPSSEAVRNNVELLKKTKQQFVTMMDNLKIVAKAVDNYNAQTASVIEEVVQENCAKLLGQKNAVDPMKLIQSLPITECEASSLSTL